MLLRVRALAAVSEQTRRDFSLDERLKKEGGGEEEEREKQTFASRVNSAVAAARGLSSEPGVRFEASQICAGKSGAAAQLVETSLLMKQ